MRERERKLGQENEEGTVTDTTFITGKHGKFYGPVGSQLFQPVILVNVAWRR